MSKEVKITLLFGLIAFFISLLFGLISGNSFSTVLMRAIVSFVLFGAITYGGLYLFSKYVPEIEELFSKPIENSKKLEEEKQTESRIDYTISDDETSRLIDKIDKKPVDKRNADIDTNILDNKDELTLKESKNSIITEGDELPPLEDLYDEEGDIVTDVELEKDEINVSNEKAVSRDNYINVGNAKMPYEPEVMAKAIKRVMKKNE